MRTSTTGGVSQGLKHTYGIYKEYIHISLKFPITPLYHPKHSHPRARCLLNTCLGHLLTPDQWVIQTQKTQDLYAKEVVIVLPCTDQAKQILSYYHQKSRQKTMNRRGSRKKLELLLKYKLSKKKNPNFCCLTCFVKERHQTRATVLAV